MHTKAVFHAAKALARIDVPVLRFNFRGVGRSAGSFSDGPGEREDFRAALAFMMARYPDVKRIWCGGMSFGSWVALTVGAEDPHVTALIGIACPVNKYDYSAVVAAGKPTFLIHGERDELIPLQGNTEVLRVAVRNRRSSSSSTAPIICSTARCQKSAKRSKISFRISMADALIVAAVRTPVGKAPNGSLRSTRPDDLAATVMREVMNRAAGVAAAEIEDVILGCAMPEAEQGLNVARIASLRAGLPVEASAVTINRFCASGLQAIAFAADRIKGGSAAAIIAGGTESMSLVPMGGNKVAPNPTLVDQLPRRVPDDRTRGGKSRARPRHLARRAGCVRACAVINARLPRSTPASSATKPSPSARLPRTKARAATRRSKRFRNCVRRFTSRAP